MRKGKAGRLLASLTLSLATASTFLVSTGSAAHATPQNCSHGRYSADAAIAICWSGTGSFRSVVRCVYSRWEGDTSYVYGYGSWRSPGTGQYSYSFCPKVNNVQSNYVYDFIELIG